MQVNRKAAPFPKQIFLLANFLFNSKNMQKKSRAGFEFRYPVLQVEVIAIMLAEL